MNENKEEDVEKADSKQDEQGRTTTRTREDEDENDVSDNKDNEEAKLNKTRVPDNVTIGTEDHDVTSKCTRPVLTLAPVLRATKKEPTTKMRDNDKIETSKSFAFVQ